MKLIKRTFISLALCLFTSGAVRADDGYLSDRNGDNLVSALAFGDSITFGVGDGTQPGVVVDVPPLTDGTMGYPARLRTLLGIPVVNSGVPGEELDKGGQDRFPRSLASAPSDFVIILEGSNDAIHRLSTPEFGRDLQKIINVAFAQGVKPLLATLPTPCCNHEGLSLFTAAYSEDVRNIAAINGVSFADLERAWKTTCENKVECELYNLPEGLHPNTLGYDVLAQTTAAALLDIDIFAPKGAAELESALSLPKGSVVVKPDL